MIVKRKKYSTRHCKDCKHHDGSFCLISYTRHDPMTTRCKEYYDPKAPFYIQGRFWFVVLIVALMITGLVMKLAH